MTGTKVESVERHGPGPSEHFVVGRVLETRPHPDADRLTVCVVDIGNQSPSQIVCGAPNVAQGQAVAVATPGAVMPDGATLGKAKLRGVESNGMILAEDELAIGRLNVEAVVPAGDLPLGKAEFGSRRGTSRWRRTGEAAHKRDQPEPPPVGPLEPWPGTAPDEGDDRQPSTRSEVQQSREQHRPNVR